MATGRWIVRTYKGKNVVEKQTKFESAPKKRKRKPPPEERLKRLINENFGYGHILVKVSVKPEEEVHPD